jgi:Rod binding domain-containing protein
VTAPALAPVSANALQPLAVKAPKPEPTAEQRKIAKDFEAILLRKMLASLEKTSQLGGSSPLTGGSEIYGSMVVGVLADAMASGGGIGLADMVAQALARGGPGGGEKKLTQDSEQAAVQAVRARTSLTKR